MPKTKRYTLEDIRQAYLAGAEMEYESGCGVVDFPTNDQRKTPRLIQCGAYLTLVEDQSR